MLARNRSPFLRWMLGFGLCLFLLGTPLEAGRHRVKVTRKPSIRVDPKTRVDPRADVGYRSPGSTRTRTGSETRPRIDTEPGTGRVDVETPATRSRTGDGDVSTPVKPVEGSGTTARTETSGAGSGATDLFGTGSGTAAVRPYKVEAGVLKPEASYFKGKKHGIKWTEGPQRASQTGNPQGQFGSKADLDYVTDRARTLDLGEYREFPVPPGHTMIVHMPGGGPPIPATRVGVRRNPKGNTVHAFPMP